MKTLRTLFTLMLLVAASGVMAQMGLPKVMRLTYLNRACVYADPVTAVPGKTCELVVYLKDNVTTDEINGWQFELQLPKGISIATVKKTRDNGSPYYVVDENSYEVSQQLHGKYTELFMAEQLTDDDEPIEGKYLFMWSGYTYYPKIPTLKSTNGELIRITLNVSSDFVSGTGKLTRICYAAYDEDDVNQSFYYLDTDVLFNVTGGDPAPDDPDPGVSGKVTALTVEDINIEPGGTSEIVVNMDYDTEETVVGYNFSLYLPEGVNLDFTGSEVTRLTLAQKKKCFTLSKTIHPDADDLERNPFEYLDVLVKTDGGRLVVWLDYDWKTPLLSTHGELLRMKVKADASFEKGIGKITEIGLTSDENASLDLGNIADVQFGINETTPGPGPDPQPNIVDYPDILNYDNALYVKSAEVMSAGGQFELPILLMNKVDVAGASLTVTLPEGLTLAKDEDDDLVYRLNDERARSGKFSLYWAENADGSVGLRIMPINTGTIAGTDGVLLTLTVNVAKGLEGGEYPVLLTQNSLTVKDGNGQLSTLELVDTRTTLTLIDVQPGDVNGDTRVDLTDAIMIVYASLGVVQPGFTEKAADINGDGRVDLTDAVIVLYQSLGVEPKARIAATRALKAPATTGDRFVIGDVELKAGETVELPIGFALESGKTMVGFQLQLNLPEGITTVRDEDNLPEYTKDETTCGKLTIYPTETDGFGALPQTLKATIKGTSGTLFTITLKADESLKPGTKLTATVTNAMFTDKDADGVQHSIDVEDFTFDITISGTEPGPQPGPHNGEKWGDVNDDGVVNVADIATIIDIMAANARLQKAMTASEE